MYLAFFKPGQSGTFLGPTLAEHRPKYDNLLVLKLYIYIYIMYDFSILVEVNTTIYLGRSRVLEFLPFQLVIHRLPLVFDWFLYICSHTPCTFLRDAEVVVWPRGFWRPGVPNHTFSRNEWVFGLAAKGGKANKTL